MSYLISYTQDNEKLKDLQKKIEAVDSQKIIENSLKKKQLKKSKFLKEELLNEAKINTIKSFLDSVRNKTIKEIKSELEAKLDEYNRCTQNVLIKADIEVKEYKKKYDGVIEEKSTLVDRIHSLQLYNKELMKQISGYQISIATIQKNYDMLSGQKTLFEEIIKKFPGKTPLDVINELETVKEGAVEMLKDYEEISQKIQVMNQNQKDLEKKFNWRLSSLTVEYDNLQKEKRILEDINNKKINNLEIMLSREQSKEKEFQELKNTLYQLYNILFEEFGLSRDINIDKKYQGIKEIDFNPNVFYDKEIKNYIKLMVKSMHSSTYDIVFRESLGYIHAIIRTFLPNKKNLRFQPVEALKEIKVFIENTVKISNDYKKEIENMKAGAKTSENDVFKIQQKLNSVLKEYDSYKNKAEKEFEKLSKIKYKVTRSSSKEKNKFYLERPGTSLLIRPLKNSINIKKEKLLTENETKSFGLNNDFDNTYFKTNYGILARKTTFSFDKEKNNFQLTKSKNNDKMIRTHGTQGVIDNIENIKCLVNETNRLYLYQPRMNSIFDTKQFRKGKEEKSQSNATRQIRKYKDNVINSNENSIKKKVFNQINGLIELTKK